MTADWEKYSFYKILEVEPGAGAEEIKKAHERITSPLEPDAAPDEEKRTVSFALIAADAALEELKDDDSRKAYDAILDDILKAAANKKKIEGKRKGKLQEQQSIEDDVKLQKATAGLDSAIDALIDLYYDRLFKRARESSFDSIPADKLMEWLNSERAESQRASREKGRGTAFQIDWRDFASVQDGRKERGKKVLEIVEELVERFQLS